MKVKMDFIFLISAVIQVIVVWCLFLWLGKKLTKSTDNEYLQDIVNSMSSMLIGVDNHGIVTHWNKRAEEFTKIKAFDAIGKSVQEMLVFLNEHLPLIDVAIDTKQVQMVDKIRYVSNNQEHFYLLMIYPLVISKAGAVLRIDDVSERVSIENTALQIEKMTSLSTLAAGMAHEINNPLGGILQGIQNVIRRLDPELKKNAEAAHAQNISLEQIHAYMQSRGINSFLTGMKDLGERAADIVKNILKFSRRNDTEMVSANINNIIEKVVSMIKAKIPIKTELDADVPDFLCSVLDIEQVLLNVMKNAVQAFVDSNGESSAPMIIVRTKLMLGTVRIEIEDNGCGISDKNKTHLFEPFFTTKAVDVGSGLGLSISYCIIVDKHSGKLSVESEENTGTTVIIELPILLAKKEDNTC